MTDRETIAAYDARVETYAGLVERDAPDPALVAFIGRLPAGGFVLDLGCGPAQASATMRDHGLRVDPVDASPEMVRLANETHAIGARVANFDAIEGTAIYDGIWANFSLLHAPPEDFPRYLSALHTALKPRGAFHIGMKLGSGARRDRLGRFYAYYTEAELTGHLETAGFTILDSAKGEDMGLAGDVEPWITLTAQA